MKNNRNGITIVALVITIIILLIIAGISISFLTGENGILSKAQNASKESKEAGQREGELINNTNSQFDKYLGKNLPENTSLIEAGTIVRLPDAWSTETMRYLATDTGIEVTSNTKVATVYAISVGNGITVPVPYGFYYVGGNLNSGVVISDSESDKNKYVSQSDVPSGFSLTDSLQPVYDLQGNQFVFIPCKTDTYKKTDFGASYQNTYWDNTTQTSELEQISKYGGFYVARYESGLSSAISPSTTSQMHSTSNQVYNLPGIPESKPGKIPWTFIDWTNAQKNSQTMYNSNYVISGLMTGTMWDTMINKISTADSTKSFTSTVWGNTKSQQLTYNGKNAALTLSTNWYLSPFSGYIKGGTKSSATGSNGWLLTTGASEQAKAYNLYDVSGNAWEWTEETSYYGGNINSQYRIARGGSCIEAYGSCYRAGTITNLYTGLHVGFRVALYMK